MAFMRTGLCNLCSRSSNFLSHMKHRGASIASIQGIASIDYIHCTLFNSLLIAR